MLMMVGRASLTTSVNMCEDDVTSWELDAWRGIVPPRIGSNCESVSIDIIVRSAGRVRIKFGALRWMEEGIRYALRLQQAMAMEY